MLTPKQEKFCEYIVSGMDGVTAYENAYNTKATPQVKRNESMKLLKRDDITERITELRKPLLNHAQNTAISERERIKAILWDRLEKAIDRGDDQTITRITDQINRMNAEYININKNIDEQKTPIEHLDTDTLLKLVE
jgi:phage terminase small subunit